MKKLPFVSALLVFSAAMLLANVTFAQRGRIDERIRFQWHHIDRAVAEGRLSERQAHFLHSRLHQIREEYERARYSGAMDFHTIHRLNEELDFNEMKLRRMEHGERGGYGYRPIY
ncbi:MAG: hypothetical protein ACP5SH_02175 [Syntrophobacteraceae bacterium]